MKRWLLLCLLSLLGPAFVPAPAPADTMKFKLLPNYSRATFKSDAPLETFVGNTAGPGIAGSLTLDPAQPRGAKGTVRVDLTAVSTGIAKRDEDMRSAQYLDTANEANRYAVFEIQSVEAPGPLQPGREVAGRVSGTLTIKQKAAPIVAEARVTYVTLTPEQVEAQKRFGFTTHNIKVRARFETSFTNHGMQVPQLLFLKVSNDIALEADLTFVRE